MKAQTITTPAGERLVMLPEAEFAALVEAAEDATDRTAVARFRRALAEGDEELVPAAIVDRILSGENRVKVWREHRGLTQDALAREADVVEHALVEIESGRQDGTVETLRRIAAVLDATLDDLAA